MHTWVKWLLILSHAIAQTCIYSDLAEPTLANRQVWLFLRNVEKGRGPAFNLSNNIKVHIDTLYIHGHFASLENYALFGHWLDRVQTPVCISKYLKFYFPGMCPRSKPSTILSKWEQQMNDLFFWVFLFCFDFCLRFWQLFISLVEALVIRGCKLCGKSWKAGEEERVKGHFRTFHPRN